jgi:hypothetical protein
VIQVLPFCGWRFDLSQVGALSEVLSPAASEICAATQRALYRLHPCNVVRLICNRDEPGDTSPADRTARADDFFRLWRKEGILVREHETAFYIVETRFQDGQVDRERWSLFGQLALQGADGQPVVPVTALKSAEEEIRACLELRRAAHADLAPVVALAEDVTADASRESLSELLERLVRQATPMECFLEHGVRHRVWAVTSEAAKNQITERLSVTRPLLISGVAQYHAAVQHAAELRQTGTLKGPNDPAGRVLTCFLGADDGGLEFQPGFVAAALPEAVSGEKFREAAARATGVQCRFVGNEAYAVSDALELAALNDDQPCVAVGTPDGEWQLLSAPARCENHADLLELLRAELLPGGGWAWQCLTGAADNDRQGRLGVPAVAAGAVMIATPPLTPVPEVGSGCASVVTGLSETGLRLYPGVPVGLVFSAHSDRVSA